MVRRFCLYNIKNKKLERWLQLFCCIMVDVNLMLGTMTILAPTALSTLTAWMAIVLTQSAKSPVDS